MDVPGDLSHVLFHHVFCSPLSIRMIDWKLSHRSVYGQVSVRSYIKAVHLLISNSAGDWSCYNKVIIEG